MPETPDAMLEAPNPLPWNAEMIYQELRGKIEAGELRPGDRLPSYVQLREQYRVSNATAARAVFLLKERGYVTGMQGLGVYVAEHKS